MKHLYFKVPYTLKRDGQGVELTLHEEEKVLQREDPIRDQDERQVVNLSAEAGNENDKQMSLAKKTLLANEDETKGHLILHYIG
jgi:hypothetical protein